MEDHAEVLTMKKTKIGILVGGAILAFALAAQQVLKKEEKVEITEIAKKELTLKQLEKKSKADPTVKSSTTWKEVIDEITRLEKRKQELKKLALEFRIKMKNAAEYTMWRPEYIYESYKQEKVTIDEEIKKLEEQKARINANLKGLRLLYSLTTEEVDTFKGFTTSQEKNSDILQTVARKFSR